MHSKLDNDTIEKVTGGAFVTIGGDEPSDSQPQMPGQECATINPIPYQEPVGQTKMKCSECGYSVLWAGDYVGKTYDCPRCGKHAYMGFA